MQTMAEDPDLLLDLDEALQTLAGEDPQAAEFAKLRLYAGLSVKEAGEILGMPSSTAHDNWHFVRAWFTCRLAAI
jgi:DNA-directed RNA polymerase specialized sigma24 family protein